MQRVAVGGLSLTCYTLCLQMLQRQEQQEQQYNNEVMAYAAVKIAGMQFIKLVNKKKGSLPLLLPLLEEAHVIEQEAGLLR